MWNFVLMCRSIMLGGKGWSGGGIFSRFKEVKDMEVSIKVGNIGKCFRDFK